MICLKQIAMTNGMKRKMQSLCPCRRWSDKLNVAARNARESMSSGSLDQQLDSVMHMFNDCDKGNKEYLTPEEFSSYKNLGVILSPEELVSAVEEIDEDGNGQIEIDEYLDWWG